MRRSQSSISVAILFAFACTLLAQSQLAPVTVQVEIVNPKAARKAASAGNHADSSNVVVWLAPLGGNSGSAAATPSTHSAPQIAQIDKSFDPHVLVVQAGTAVPFSNRNPFLPTVFFLFFCKRCVL